MSRSPNHFKIGLFVLIATGLAILGVVMLGSGVFFEEKIMAETYVDESVQGLDVGSPVKHRGVQIGRVERITFVRNKYSMDPNSPEYFDAGKYVLIEFSLVQGSFESRGRDLEDTIRELVDAGLRVQLVPTSLATGLVYLEADYVKPGEAPPLKLSWTPEYIYIPSRPSAFANLGSRAGSILERIERLDVEKVFGKTEELLDNMNKALTEAKIGELSEKGRELVDDLKETNARIQEILGEERFNKLIDESTGTVASARRSAENFEKNLPEILDNLRVVSNDIKEISASVKDLMAEGTAKTALSNLAEMSGDLRSASQGLPDVAEGAGRAIRNADRLLQEQAARIDMILRNIESASQNIRDLTRDAKRYPSHVILGEPPPRIDPGK